MEKTALILKNSDKDLATWLSELRDPSRCKTALEELVNLETDKEEIKGLKLFLRQNNGDIESLWLFFDQNKNQPFRNKTKKINASNIIGIAASILVILGLAVSYLMKEESVIDKYSIYDPGLPVLMSSTIDYEIGNWMQEYKAGNFERALEKGNELIQEEPRNDTILYYQGIIQMRLSHIENAIELFDLVRKNRNSNYVTPAQYNLALCYLSLERTTTATSLLNQVAASSNDEYAEQARELLAKEIKK